MANFSNSQPADRYAALSDDDLRLVHVVCEIFERTIRQAGVSIETLLDSVPDEQREFIFSELLAAEVQFRVDHQESPTAEEYERRFPDRSDSIRFVFEANPTLNPVQIPRRQKSTLPENSLESTIGQAEHDTADFVGGDSRDIRHQAVADRTSRTARRYQVVRPHAKGGLGEVFVAKDLELQREVALKEIQPRFADRSESRARFVLEAEITGGLEHPGIVPVYGFGHYADGRPFYAMRFIRGKSFSERIADFHEADASNTRLHQELELRKLLGRFVDVCNAISYAHSRGVLHRDLKPANVMLGDFGETLVVDWGLAKTASSSEANSEIQRGQVESDFLLPPSGSGVEPTADGTTLGTPAYMSPEQASGRLNELGPGSDVYGLGAILYSLLCGQPPIQADSPNQVLEKARIGDIPTPSSIRPDVPTGLEAICLKAMSRVPADRYLSARELADDVERYLADEAVTARVDPLPTRIWRWIRKHRTVSATAAAAALVGMVALGISNTLIRGERNRTSEQRDLALNNFRLAQDSVDRYFTVVSESKLLNTPGMQPLQQQLLSDALDYYIQFIALQEDTPGLQLEYAKAHHRVGQVQALLGFQEEAIEAFMAARDIFVELAEQPNCSVEILVDAANSHFLLSKTHLASGNHDEAARFIERARNEFTILKRDFPDDVQVHLSSLNADNALSNVHLARGEFPAASEVLSAAVEQAQALQGRYPDDAEVDRMLVFVLGGLASPLAQQGDIENATDLYERAAELHAAIIAQDDRTPQDLESYATTLHNYGNILQYQGLYEEALLVVEQQRDVYHGLMTENPAVLDYQLNYAEACTNFGVIHGMSGIHDVAEESFREASTILERLSILRPTHIATQRAFASSYVNLAKEYQFLGQSAEALRHYQKGLDLTRDLAESNPDAITVKVSFGRALQNVALTLVKEERFVEAFPLFEEAETVRSEIVQAVPQDPYFKSDLASVLHAKAKVLVDMGRSDQAPAVYLRAIEQDQQALTSGAAGPFLPRLLFHYDALIGVLKELDRRVDAETAIDEMLALDGVTPDQLYNAACAYSVFAGRIGDDLAENDVAETQATRAAYIAAAIDLLQKAISAGWGDLEHIQEDAELDAISETPEFEELLNMVRQL